MAVKRVGTIKILGYTFDVARKQTTQLAATKLRLAQACTVIGAQRRLDFSVIAATLSTLPRALYTGQFLPLSSSDLRTLDIPLNKLHKRKTKNQQAFANALLHLPPSQCGLGVPRLSDHITTRKWSMAQRALASDGNVARAVDGLLDRAVRSSGSLTTPGHPSYIGALTTQPVWGSSFGLRDLPSPSLRLHRGLCSSLLDEALAVSIPPALGIGHSVFIPYVYNSIGNLILS